MRRSSRAEAQGARAFVRTGGTHALAAIRKNGRLWTADCPAALARNDIPGTSAAFAGLSRRYWRHGSGSLWKKWSGYHVCSRIEAGMRNLKSFGERIASRDHDRQTAEIHIRVSRGCARTDGACRSFMHRFNALGTAEIERVASPQTGKGHRALKPTSAKMPFRAFFVARSIRRGILRKSRGINLVNPAF